MTPHTMHPPGNHNRSNRWRAACASLATCGAMLLVSPFVSAEGASPSAFTAEECIAISETALKLRRSNQLLEARAQAALCTHDSCPAVIRTECAQLGQTWAQAQPRVTFHVINASGDDVSDVSVTADAKALGHQMGAGVELDPGEHKVRFESPGYEPLEKALVVREGDKERVVSITLKAVVEPASSTADTPPATVPQPLVPAVASVSSNTIDDAETHQWNNLQLAGVVTAGVGVLGLATGGALVLWARSAHEDSLGEGCDRSGQCPTNDGKVLADKAQERAQLATWFAIGGAAFTVGGALLYLLNNDSPNDNHASNALVVMPVAGPQTIGISVSSCF